MMLAPVEAKLAGANGTERREGAARQRLMLKVAKLRCSSGEYPCVILDVSESGTRLRLFNGHPADSHMFLELSNGEFYAIERRWVRGDEAGYRFSCKIDVVEFIGDGSPLSRRPIRLRIQHHVSVFTGTEPGHAMLANISARGACIEAGRQLAVGSLVRIEVAGWPPRHAHVCWRKDYRHGLSFQQELSLQDLARLAAELQPFVPHVEPIESPAVALPRIA